MSFFSPSEEKTFLLLYTLSKHEKIIFFPFFNQRASKRRSWWDGGSILIFWAIFLKQLGTYLKIIYHIFRQSFVTRKNLLEVWLIDVYSLVGVFANVYLSYSLMVCCPVYYEGAILFNMLFYAVEVIIYQSSTCYKFILIEVQNFLD